MNYHKSEAKEYAREILTGIWSTLPTPFTLNDELDVDGLRENVDHVANLGTSGMGCNWLGGEFWSLSEDEKRTCARIVVDECHKRKVQAVVNCSHHSAKECVSMMRYAETVGATFAALLPPYFNIKAESDAIRFIEKVAEQVDIGIMIHNNPICGVPLSPEGLAKVAEVKNIVGVKDAVPDIQHSIHTHLLAGDSMVVSRPNEDIFFVERYFGFHQQVLFATACDWMFDLPDGSGSYVKWVNKACNSGVDDAAIQLYRRKILPLKRVHDDYWDYSFKRDKGAFPAPLFKAWAEYVGMRTGDIRGPPMGFTKEEKRELWSKLGEAGLRPSLRTKVPSIAHR